eukprot:jgi/Tetstr1/465027/TSEL_009755.t1
MSQQHEEEKPPRSAPVSVSALVESMDRLFAGGEYTLGENMEVGMTAAGVGDPRVAFFYKLVRGIPDTEFGKLFASVAACPAMVEDLFVLAFQTRDVRGGKGEKALFLRFVHELYALDADLTIAVLPLVPEYGSWLDIVKIAEIRPEQCRLRSVCTKILCDQLLKDSEEEKPSLAAKWAPREGRSRSAFSRELACLMFPGVGCPRRSYRKLVAGICKRLDVTETKMCGDMWDEILPGSVPSKCLSINRRAFLNVPVSRGRGGVAKVRSESAKRVKCAAAFLQHAQDAALGKGGKVMHGAALHPHEIVSRYLKSDTCFTECVEPADPILEAQWTDLRDSFVATLGAETKQRAFMIPLVDVSASMSGTPMESAIALGILLSETTHETFRGRVLTFESRPRWVNFAKCETLQQKVAKVRGAPWGGSTNFAAAMDLILGACVLSNIPASEVESMVMVVFSDMQFDVADGGSVAPYYSSTHAGDNWATSYNKMCNKFADHGYSAVPHIVFWNLRGDTPDFPASAATPGVSMLSGFSPAMMAPILAGDLASIKESAELAKMDPADRPDAYSTLRAILDSERYSRVRSVVRDHFSTK